MQSLHDRVSIEHWPMLDQRALLVQVLQRMTQGEPYDSATHGYFLMVEAGDRLDELSRTIGRVVEEGSWEYLDEHPGCFEMVFVLADSGYGVVVIIPKDPQVDPALLQLCTRLASPAVD